MIRVIFGPNSSGKTSLARREMIQSPSASTRMLSFQDCYGGTTDREYYSQQRFNATDIRDPRILLSSGELRKLRLSQALSSNPRKLYIDNPYIGLDKASRQSFQATLGDLGDKMDLVLLVSRKEEIHPRTATLDVLNPTKAPHTLDENLRNEILSLPSTSRGEEGESVIRMQDINLSYGERKLFDGLDWEVKCGSRWALTGPNGSGKSTLLSLVTADNPRAYAMDLSLFGRRRGTGESIWDIKRRIGYVSPELHREFHEDRTVEYMVGSGAFLTAGLYGKLSGENKDSAHLWMEVFGIEHLSARSYLTLSSSEQRLCLLSRAFVRDPELLILDEPMHGLDEWNRALAKDVITTFCARKGKTLVMVSHYDEEFPEIITHRLDLGDKHSKV